MIENIPYLSDPGAVSLIDGAVETIRAFRAAGFAIVVVTNQSGVARGLISAEQYLAVEARIIEQLGPGLVDASYACPFHPEGQGDFGDYCSWRKPKGGMLMSAAKELQLDLPGSVMVGDSLSDVMAGAEAGAGFAVHVLTGHGAGERNAVEEWATSRNQIEPWPQFRFVGSIADIGPAEFAR
ncbi:HAD-IIIA family hydrolase [Sphingomonas sp. So64.6b]|uniref:D-glycero-alpha-D-manno-heptose-1,7-bisphosphate 7-phosphatase n=1 Tax=Sphingomonas sp. So64.6b TaxID=2997354 RepID=UPI0015FFA566|nr:HAD-IIIA family hydrolase [Sphingomonas sp. So64.6b]QNA82913.1 HAD-IIIA family hydrolase [Sphingomonas sp. So64.6b]